MSKPLVNICMITYNHAPFLAEAINSILSQKTDFEYCLVIGEDCSPDATRKICEEYAAKYPKKINLLPSTTNLGMTKNFIRTLKACDGKYIAFCEGDDFWTDVNKLQIQVDLLEANPDYNGCFHDVSNSDKNSNIIKENFYEAQQQVYNQEECLKVLGSRYSTCSVLFRREILDGEWPIWFNKRACDEFLDLMITQNGLLVHIPKNMASYRIHEGGIWQGTNTFGRLKESIYRMELLLSDAPFKAKYGAYLKSELFEHIRFLLFHQELSMSAALEYYFKIIKHYGADFLKSPIDLVDLFGIALFKKSFLGLAKKLRLSKAERIG